MTGPTLRRRDDGALELRVNGVFVMDDVETSSERALARTVIDLGAREILVGGLGLGYTLRALLASPQVKRVVVAELHPEIVGWMHDGTIPGADLLTDERTQVVVGDVRDVVAAQSPASLDAIALDVDNGPEFLVHDDNAAVYQGGFVEVCASRLRPGGHLCVWSMNNSRQLWRAMDDHLTDVREEAIAVRLQDRDERYWIVSGTRRPDVAVAD
jgi:spermidine synthase